MLCGWKVSVYYLYLSKCQGQCICILSVFVWPVQCAYLGLSVGFGIHLVLALHCRQAPWGAALPCKLAPRPPGRPAPHGWWCMRIGVGQGGWPCHQATFCLAKLVFGWVRFGVGGPAPDQIWPDQIWGGWPSVRSDLVGSDLGLGCHLHGGTNRIRSGVG